MWQRIKLATGAGTLVILVALAGGTWLLLNRTEEAARLAANAALERTAQAVENTLNRQLLQVDGALASLPALFAGASPTGPLDAFAATQLLRGLNFQSFAFRDLTLVTPSGVVWAATRGRTSGRVASVDPGDFAKGRASGSSLLLGPIRNRITGDWSLYLGRSIVIPQTGEFLAVGEVPLPVLMRFLAETGVGPGIRISLQRRSGQLIASLPHDEVRTGQILAGRAGPSAPNGQAADVAGEPRTIVVRRSSLYDDVIVELSIDRQVALAEWERNRDRLLIAVASAALLIGVFVLALLAALRQRERADIERIRAGTVLANALDAMSDGFMMWDENDRLVTCNKRVRDLFSIAAPFMVKDATYADVVRNGVAGGQYAEPVDDIDEFVAKTVAWHRQGTDTVERLLAGGRWVSMTERRTTDGYTVGIRTDITAVKTALADLAAANDRAQQAAEEARRQNAELVERESRISFLAHHDDLTKLPNRVLFRRQIETALQGALHEGEGIALLYLDLDRFKDINDTLGHPAGDALLRAVADRLRACIREGDLIARLGGDEFAIVAARADQPSGAEVLSDRLIAELSRPFDVFGHRVVTGASIGIAVADDGSVDPDTLLKQADLALYEAKAAGRGTGCVFAQEMSERLGDRLQLGADLRSALPGGELGLVYQPIYNLASGRLIGFEALLRWHHPVRGEVSPSIFVPVAEETGMIVEIGAWVLDRACSDFAKLPDGLKISVNLSPLQLASGDIVSCITNTLEQTRLPAHRLELEITETALFANDHRSLEILQKLRALGTRLVLDDFGTGYSSLSHLHRYPLDKIKIDRSFVKEMPTRRDSAAIVAALAGLASQLGKTTTAEGIETQEQMELVRAAGCTEVQGYLLGRPQTIHQVIETVRRDRAAAAGELAA